MAAIPSGWLPLAAYVAAFGLAALACLAAVPRARHIDDPETRRGLVALLVTSGAWAGAHVGYLLAPMPAKEAVYVAGLVVGLAAVGPWLYLCSAYTGRSLHRRPALRRLAVAVFAGLVLVKLTNPVHGLYLETAPATAPFAHLAVEHGLAHWLTMGLAYALAAVGYFMLVERFLQVGASSRPLVVLATLTGLPLVLDVVGVATPVLLDMTYEPLGVAAFAVGVLFLYRRRFESVRLAGSREQPTVVLGDDGRLREVNRPAAALFPGLDDRSVLGRPLADVVPDLAAAVEDEGGLVELERDGQERYYRVTASPMAAGQARLGRVVVLADVTHRERYRHELERQNRRLEAFASMVSHDLRNPLTVAKGRVDLAREERDDGHLASAAEALDRMEALIDDVLQLARQGRPIDELESVSLGDVARAAWAMVESDAATLTLEADRRLAADRTRLQQLLENLFRNAVEHGGHGVTVRVGPLDDGFYVEDDGPGIPEEDRERVFESGFSTAASGTGFGLAIVEEIAGAHGWSIEATAGEAGGARFEVTGVTA